MPSLCSASVRLVKRLVLFHIVNLVFATSQAASQPGAGAPRPDQLITLEVKAEPVKTVLQQIEQQAGVRFQYSKELIGADRRVTVTAVNRPLAEVLQDMLAPLHIRYEILEYGIVLTPAAADGTLTGRVVDDKGEPLPGVTVRVEGTLIGNYTDGEGRYTLTNVPPGPQFLVFSSVGYVTVRLPFTLPPGQGLALEAGQGLVLDATLAEDVKQLQEVVVVGYGTARRQDVTGSVATVSSKDFVQGQVTDPTRLIQGKVAGVQIAAGGGAPGEFGVIRIRGGSSLSASNDPLIVIDGVPVDNNGINGAGNPLALINPNDIETFTVLKDASATAIYGSRASNGVLLITTKKGAVGEPMHVTLNSQVSRSTNYGRVQVLTGDQYRRLTQQVDAAQFKEVPTNRSAYLGTANTDWQKEIYQTAYTTDNSLSLTGSVKKLPYRVSVGYLDQQGTLKTGYMKRATGSVGLSPRLLDGHLRIDLNVKGTSANYRFADQGAISSAVLFDPTQPIRTGESRFNGYYEWLDPANNAPQQLTTRNPVALLTDKRDVSHVLRTIGNIQLDYQLHFLPDLHANLNLGYDISRSQVNRDIGAESSLAYLIQGLKQQEKQTRNTGLLEFYLKYAKALGGHHLEALAGYSYQDFYRYSPSNFTYTAAGTRLDTTGTLPLPFKTQNTLVSFYGRLNYAFRDRYLVTATLRNDGSSHFAPGNKFGLFPAASVAWRVGQEAFLADSRLISELKVRASYGITGQQDIFNASGTDFPYLARYQLGNSSVQQQFGNQYVSTYRPASYDANLRWEQTETYNAGLDFGLVRNRLSGAVDLYFRRTTDLITDIPVPVGTNLSNHVTTNIGSLENKGVEFALNYNILQNPEGLNWSANVNATMNRNRITKLTQVSDPSYLGTQVNGYQINSVGYPANSFFVLKQLYDERGKPIENNTDRTKMYADLNHDGLIDQRDYYRYKSPAPKVILGFSSNLSYKNLSLAFTVRSNIGGYVYNNVLGDRSAFTSLYPSQPFLLNGIAGLYATQFHQPQLNSDFYVQNASFVRLENVTLGYNLGGVVKRIWTKTPRQPTLRITAAVQNALVLTKYMGVNPELFYGIDNLVYPLPRTFTLGLTAGF